MEEKNYNRQDHIEKEHWWYKCRRNMIAHHLKKQKVSTDAIIFDGGTSTGTNLRLLKELGYKHYFGLDYSRIAIDLCKAKKLGATIQGDLTNIPCKSESVDCVLATDVFEHIDDDQSAVSECYRILKKDQIAIFTVPTFQCIWGLQDEVSHHKRRYLLKDFITIIEHSGFRVELAFYHNYFLFLPIWLARIFIRVFKINISSEGEINTNWLNKILKIIFSIDIWSASFLKPPFGVSAFVLARK